jgi:hypothetical protein
MKTILISFAIVLFLLMLLSAFGGSMKPTEPFYEVVGGDSNIDGGNDTSYNADEDEQQQPQQQPQMQPQMQDGYVQDNFQQQQEYFIDSRLTGDQKRKKKAVDAIKDQNQVNKYGTVKKQEGFIKAKLEPFEAKNLYKEEFAQV